MPKYNELKAALAAAYRTNGRQFNRWIADRAPVLDARRMLSRLSGQNNGGATCDLLRQPGEIERIQREIDYLIGDDVATCGALLDGVVAMDEWQSRLLAKVAKSHVSNKAAWMRMLRQIRAAIKATDKLLLVESVFAGDGDIDKT